jgi:hypothetical protein
VAHRTTLTIEDDVMDQIERETRRTGRAFKAIVNDALRVGLLRTADATSPRFRVEARDMGVRPGVDLDDIEGMLDRLDGPDRR